MKKQNYFDIIAKAKKEFDTWVQNEPMHFKCLQFVFPFSESDTTITTWIFFLHDNDIKENEINGNTRLIKEKFKILIKKHRMPSEVIDNMLFEIDSNENVKSNFEGNYFYRLR
jgi:hypothetical protein